MSIIVGYLIVWEFLRWGDFDTTIEERAYHVACSDYYGLHDEEDAELVSERSITEEEAVNFTCAICGNSLSQKGLYGEIPIETTR